MTIAEWLPPELTRPAGLALLHSLWQITALAAVAALATPLARRASTRYAITVAALVLSVAAPAATFALLYTGGAVAGGLPVDPLAAALGRVREVGVSVSPAPGAAADYAAWAVALWLAGVVVFSGRAAGGFALLTRLRRGPGESVGPALEALCEDLRRELGLGRVVRYVACDWLETPAAVGWLRPVIYLPLAALSGLSETQLRAVIGHELAHVRRLDALVNGFQIVAEALLFYHPAAWWLNRRIREEREHCCDDVAAAVCGDPVDYARALLSLEEARVAPPFALAANGGGLRARIARLLSSDAAGPGMRAASAIVAGLALAAALSAGACLFGFEFGVSWRMKMHGPHLSAVHDSVHEHDGDDGDDRGDDGNDGDGDESDLEQLVAFRVHGVTPEFIRSIRSAGYLPDADELVSMRIHGVTPEYIAELRLLGVPGLRAGDLAGRHERHERHD